MPSTAATVRVPQITSLETAIRLYYERIELSNSDIRELFGKLAPATIKSLKNKAQAIMTERNTPIWNAQRVNTEKVILGYIMCGAVCGKGVLRSEERR